MRLGNISLLLMSQATLLLAEAENHGSDNNVRLRPVPDFLRGTQQHGWHAPTHEYFERIWFTTYTSNPLYPVKVKNLQYQFAPVLNGGADGPLHDVTSYQNINDTKGNGLVYASHGLDTPFKNLDASYRFNGTGLLNFVGLQVAVLAWGKDEHMEDYLVAYLGGNDAVYPSSVDILSQSTTGPDAKTLDAIKKALKAANDPAVPLSMIKQLKPVVQDKRSCKRHPVLNLEVLQNTGPSLLV